MLSTRSTTWPHNVQFNIVQFNIVSPSPGLSDITNHQFSSKKLRPLVHPDSRHATPPDRRAAASCRKMHMWSCLE